MYSRVTPLVSGISRKVITIKTRLKPVYSQNVPAGPILPRSDRKVAPIIMLATQFVVVEQVIPKSRHFRGCISEHSIQTTGAALIA